MSDSKCPLCGANYNVKHHQYDGYSFALVGTARIYDCGTMVWDDGTVEDTAPCLRSQRSARDKQLAHARAREEG